jgi:glycosyltransferase involved in cell wall biosynthesis
MRKRSSPDVFLSIKEAAAEIIVVDTGSHDHTREIAAEFTDQVYFL